jgi:hypothetical protein
MFPVQFFAEVRSAEGWTAANLIGVAVAVIVILAVVAVAVRVGARR